MSPSPIRTATPAPAGVFLALPSSSTDVVTHTRSIESPGTQGELGRRVFLPGLSPAALPFELAAVLCGHDPTCPVGAAEARHDFRVWDLVHYPTNEGDTT